MRRPLAAIATAAVVLAAVVVFFLPAPAGYTPQTMHAAALCILVIGLWVRGAMPEHIVGLLLFFLAMVLAIAPASVVFSGFASGTLWLVLGGLIIAEAVNSTGLGERFARFLIGRHTLSYRALIAAVVLVFDRFCVWSCRRPSAASCFCCRSCRRSRSGWDSSAAASATTVSRSQ